MQIDRETTIELANETLDRMAPDDYCREPYWTATDDELERFAKLVAERSAIVERERWLKAGARGIDMAVNMEREACAKVCENAIASIWEYSPDDVKQAGTNVCNNLAAAIRARGNHGQT